MAVAGASSGVLKQKDELEVVRIMLDKGMEVNVRLHGETPLMLAASRVTLSW